MSLHHGAWVHGVRTYRSDVSVSSWAEILLTYGRRGAGCQRKKKEGGQVRLCGRHAWKPRTGDQDLREDFSKTGGQTHQKDGSRRKVEWTYCPNEEKKRRESERDPRGESAFNGKATRLTLRSAWARSPGKYMRVDARVLKDDEPMTA